MNSLANEVPTWRRIASRGIALAVFLLMATLSAYQAYKVRIPLTQEQIAKAEDEVYEAVIRHMVSDWNSQTRELRLVFDDRLIVDNFPGGDIKSCQSVSAKWAQVVDEPPPFDTGADKMYRLITSGVYGTTPGPEVMESYLQRPSIGGEVSRTFRTDIPKSFIGNDDFRSGDPLGPIGGDSKFANLFPGAWGIIGLSHAGFNQHLDEAIVSTSYVCGGLCGSGHRYFLKNVGGQWKVVSSRVTWVS